MRLGVLCYYRRAETPATLIKTPSFCSFSPNVVLLYSNVDLYRDQCAPIYRTSVVRQLAS